MSGCFGNHPIDRLMERGLNDYLDSNGLPQEIKFNHKLDGSGTVTAVYNTCTEDIKKAHWCFDKDADVELESWERRELCEVAQEIMRDSL